MIYWYFEMIYQRASFFAPMRLGVSFLISQIVLLLSDLSLSRLYHHFLVVANQLFCLSFCSTLTSSLFAVSMVPFTFDTGGKSYEILGLIIFLITGKKIKKKSLSNYRPSIKTIVFNWNLFRVYFDVRLSESCFLLDVFVSTIMLPFYESFFFSLRFFSQELTIII